MDDLLQEFLTEATEGLSILDQDLVRLEQTPDDPELLAEIFRIVHTIKGTCGFLGLPRLEAVAHVSEDVLGKFRDGDVKVTPDAVSLILESLDTITMILSVIGKTEAEPEGNDEDLIARLSTVAEGGTAQPTATVVVIEDEFATPPAADGVSDDAEDEAGAAEEMESEGAVVVAVDAEGANDGAKGGRREDGALVESILGTHSIRVHVDLLEDLMNMVSELVLTRNQLLQILRANQETEFSTPLQRLNQVTSELQEGVMQTRMQPIGNAWGKLPRVVRDLALELGKKIDLDLHGADTELDRQVLEMVKDPLTHMVRNSADHGIETIEDRRKAGKPETGVIRLDARHQGGHIIIEISDDGRGISVEKLKAKALKIGAVTEAALAAMSDQQVQQLVFKAGVSTAKTVTSVSGRGVGMDVVRTNVEKIGGTVELTSVEGKGTTVTIKIPLTMAIVNALIIECSHQRFAIPQTSVVELVRASATSEHKVEWIKGVPVLRLRNKLLPLVLLHKLMSLEKEQKTDDENHFIIVSQVGNYDFGIIVDRVFDTEEIVVKPVAPILRDNTLFSGNTILGDGSVVMILDPNGIAAATGDVALADHDAADRLAASAVESAAQADRMALLIFRAEVKGPAMAVPLSLVARLEEIDTEKVEQSDGKPVVQYRDKLMPLVLVDEAYGIKESGRQPVLVFADRGRNVGLVVAEIVDIVEERLDVELMSDRDGMLGSAVIAGQATDIIDAGFYLNKALAEGFGAEPGDSSVEGRRILLVDDSAFFRNLLTPLLSVAGYSVTTADSASSALRMCEEGEDFDVILSDIEMPGMSGFEFAETVKKGGRWQNTPLVALSSHTSRGDLDRGRAVGFTDYVAKFDRDALLSTLSETLSEIRGAA